jgi:hypothetical protein
MEKQNTHGTGKALGTLTIDGRYNGPNNIANGGYVCGLLAKFIEGAADVWIRRPTPLDCELSMIAHDDGSIFILSNGDVVVEGKPGHLDLDMPESPGFESALAASKTSRALQLNEFNNRRYLGIHPTCFCCGAERDDHDGLKIHPGRIPGKDIIAAPWIPGEDLADEQGHVRPEFIWTAMDCPGAFAAMDLAGGRPGLLGRLIGQIILPIRVNEPCVVIGRVVSMEGRKYLAGTAVYNSKGQLAGKGLATWIGRA